MNQQSIAELLAFGRDRLRQAGCPDHEESARRILEHVLNKNPHQLQMALHFPASSTQIAAYQQMIERRAARYPLQYIIGYTDFYNIRCAVDERVFIPRPETEILVEKAIEHLARKPGSLVVDVGTGSGNIAIAIAYNVPSCRVIAADISSSAIDVASNNARQNGVSQRVELVTADCLQPQFWATLSAVDLIVCNPPYVTATEFADLPPEIKLYEPHIALVPSGDPLEFYRTVILLGLPVMNKHGVFLFEVSPSLAEQVANILRGCGVAEVIIVRDYCDRQRVVGGRTNTH